MRGSALARTAHPALRGGVDRAPGSRETMFWLPEHRTLVPGDRILGAPGGGLTLCPESWLYWVRVDRAELRTLLKPLLDLPIERGLVSHGEPVLSRGTEALCRCLST